MARTTRHEVDQLVKVANNMLAHNGKGYRLKLGYRYDYWAIDSVKPNDEHVVINGPIVTGNMAKIVTWLNGFTEALS